ncbi:alpha/beta hydrolase family protein [Parafilimonas sp.]|uniref:alpha/beta hydrolase family protein n=1 Tax=Parafilimonas sp. TaxID=1969739 RepID=UPI0039E3BEA7
MKLKLLIIIMISLFAINGVNAQANFSGVWSATLKIAGNIRLILHVKQLPDETYTATFDSPDQKTTGIQCDTIFILKDAAGSETLTFTINKYKVSYTGKLLNDTTLSGTFTQVANVPLDFHRGVVPPPPVVIRPQTPKPPFPYRSEEIVYNRNGLQYGGTITIPQGSGKFPAILLITGSGQQDRDETIFSHKPFAVLADALTRDGFVVLRVDDRGIGNSTGNFEASTSADFAKDVNASLDYLRSRPEVNDKKLGLLGHSEGGMIAPMVASARKDVKFIVLLAAPGVKIIDLMAEQNAAIMRSAGIDASFSESFKPVYTQLISIITSAPDSASAMANGLPVLTRWQSTADTANLRKLGFKTPDDNREYINEQIAATSTPWFTYFIQFNPQPYLSKLKKIKVLALNGSKDIQVVASQNLPAIQSALIGGKTKKFEVKELPGLNHLFQACNLCTVAEYGKLQETISPFALQTITDWLNRNVK